MKFIELFAGIGGMGYGLMQAGMECVGYCEIDKFAHKAYKILHDPAERMWEAYDVRSVTDDDIRHLGRERGPIQLIAAGFPCQTFSVAGKREGFADSTRGTLFFEIVRFASILRPEYLLLENVTGLLNHDNGRTFETIIRTLDELGYVGEWCVLNSAAYVPQNRERVFIVASLGGSGGRKIFPFGTENPNPLKELTSGVGDADRVYDASGIARTLKAEAGGGGAKTGWYRVLQRNFSGQYSTYEGRTGTLQASRVDKVPMLLEPDPMFTLTVADRHGVAIPGVNDIARTVRAGGRGSYDGKHTHDVIHDGYRIRKLTPLECFRLQSFPDEWYYKLKEHGISDSQMYKMAGNAVTSVVAYEIGKRIMEAYKHQITRRNRK